MPSPQEILHDPLAERAVLGSLMIDPDCMDRNGVKALAPGDFYVVKHQWLFETMRQLDAQDKPLNDLVLLSDTLGERMNEIRLDYITGLLDSTSTPSSLHVGHYAEIVKRLAGSRRLAYSLQGIVREVYERGVDTDPNALAAEIARKISQIVPRGRESPERKTIMTAAELMATQFPDPVWAVPGILPVGLTFLAGRPKIGKSWLALQIAVAVSTGGRVLDLQVQPGRVLYLAMEDSFRRLKERLARQHAPGEMNATFTTEWPTFGVEGGLVHLQNAIAQHKYSLVVIDTVSRAIGRADQLDLAQMTGLMGSLQQLAQLNGITILAVDHHAKRSDSGSNPIDDLIGSTAKAAVADASIGMYREKGKRSTTMKATGRDFDDKELALEWDGVTCCWQLLGEAGSVQKNTVQAAILQAMDALADMGEPVTNINIAHYLDKDAGNVYHAMSDLISTGLVVKGPKEGREQTYKRAPEKPS